MIRAANFGDLPRLFTLVCDQHEASKYYPDVGVDEPTLRSYLMQGVQRHGGTNSGSTCLFVEEHDGQVEGFVMGILERLYHIGDRLWSNDMFLVCTDDAPKMTASRLIDAYDAWAFNNPKVAKILLSWTDAIGTDGKKIEALYKRKGYHHIGGIWERAGK